MFIVAESPQVHVVACGVLIRFEVPIDQEMTIDSATLMDEQSRAIRSRDLNKRASVIRGDTLCLDFNLGAYR